MVSTRFPSVALCSRISTVGNDGNLRVCSETQFHSVPIYKTNAVLFFARRILALCKRLQASLRGDICLLKKTEGQFYSCVDLLSEKFWALEQEGSENVVRLGAPFCLRTKELSMMYMVLEYDRTRWTQKSSKFLGFCARKLSQDYNW